jgi:hypothetical protein
VVELKRRTKRDLGVLVAVLAVIGGVAFANSQLRRTGLAGDFEALREQLEAKRLSSGINLLKWNIVRSTTGNLRAGAKFSEELAAYDGKQVLIIGFMVPEDTFRDVNHFLLLPIPLECYFCSMPPQRDVLLVRMREGTTTNIMSEPVLIRGTLALQRGPGIKFFYSLEDASFEAAEDGGALTQKRLKLQHMIPSHEKDDSMLLPGASDEERSNTD